MADASSIQHRWSGWVLAGAVLLFLLAAARFLALPFRADDYYGFLWAGHFAQHPGELLTSPALGKWRPLNLARIVLQCLTLGDHPAWHHLINLGAHLGNVFLLRHLLGRWGLGLAARNLTAAAWCLSVNGLESLAYIAASEVPLVTALLLGSLLLFDRGITTAHRGWTAGALGVFLLGLLFWEAAALLPVVFAGIAWGRGKRGRDLVRWLGLPVAMTVAYAAGLLAFQQAEATRTFLAAFAHHPVYRPDPLLLNPLQPAVVTRWLTGFGQAWRILASRWDLLAQGGVAVGLGLAWRRRTLPPWGLAGIFGWTGLFLLPLLFVNGFPFVASPLHRGIANHRFFYLPGIGVALALGLALAALAGRRPWRAGLAGLLVLGLAGNFWHHATGIAEGMAASNRLHALRSLMAPWHRAHPERPLVLFNFAPTQIHGSAVLSHLFFDNRLVLVSEMDHALRADHWLERFFDRRVPELRDPVILTFHPPGAIFPVRDPQMHAAYLQEFHHRLRPLRPEWPPPTPSPSEPGT